MAIKLLIVDDAPFIREVLRRALDVPEIDIVGEAGDGRLAVRLARELKPDVILMDVVMPNLNGLEAAAEILKHLPHVQIIACSTIDQNQLVLRALDAGCSGFVAKPFTAKDVVTAVRSAAENLNRG